MISIPTLVGENNNGGFKVPRFLLVRTPTSYTVKFQTYSKTFLNVFTLILFWRIEMIPHLRGYADLGLKMRFSFFVLS